ncbi:MAG TPA: aminopeptidase [Firmicutes bacterium]|nr:aminopeptidase [Bacillota bacterium]
MRDPRIEKLAKLLIHYSVALKPKQRILIDVVGLEIPLAKALIREANTLGAKPFLNIQDHELLGELLRGAQSETLAEVAAWEKMRMSQMDAYIGIRAGRNTAELAGVPPEDMERYQTLWLKPVHGEIRVPHTRWCVLRYPNHAMAQAANRSTEEFEDFYFAVCTMDYPRMAKAMDALVARMENTDVVRIVGPGTDLSFSITGMPAIKCCGLRNIPDGEVYTAPIRDSVEGVITYNTASVYQGVTFENISFRFKQGKIIDAHSNNDERLERILATDEGARYIGEFSLGLNPYIKEPMKDTLFDEKIDGSFHFTPGNAYTICDNGNRSAIHWDLVCIQRPDKGGGEIYFDGELVRKDGRFVVSDLAGLNPEALMSDE